MNLKRSFVPGEEWLYYKIYSGPKFLEELLVGEIYEALKFLKEKECVDKFFFIRYRDNDGYHLRIRFHFTNPKDVSEVILYVTDKIKTYVEKRIIWKITLDTYNREIERYGELIYENVESIFDISSMNVLEILKQESDLSNQSNNWVQGIQFTEEALDLLSFSDLDKRILYNKFYTNYSFEFNSTNELFPYLKSKYRENHKLIENSILNKQDATAFVILKKLSEPLKEISKKYETGAPLVALDSLLMSVFHMHFNRLLLTKASITELFIYYMMATFYYSKIAKDERIHSKNK